MHSILGVITNKKYSANSRFYKTEVTIENGFGTKYSAVMECEVEKKGETLKIASFDVY